MSDPPTPPSAVSPSPPTRRADGLSRRGAKVLVVAMVVGMIGFILVISLLSPKQVRYAIPPNAEWGEPLIIDRSDAALRTLGHSPLAVVRPNPDDPAADAAVVDRPENPIYQTVYWDVVERGEIDGSGAAGGEGEAETTRWRVIVKQLGNEFIAWPKRAD
ncbi:MAG: hypothetical protein AAGB29_08870 [Planctomycetota bacterium]